MKYLYVIALIMISTIVHGQEHLSKSRAFTIKFPVSSLTRDIFYSESMGLGLGFEKMIKPSFSFSQEISYIFHVKNKSFLGKNLESINGIGFTTEIRKYLSKKELPESGWFTNIEFKNIFTSSIESTGHNQDNKIKRYRGVITTNLGILFYWDKNKNSRITLEILGGVGLGYINASSSTDVENLNIKSDYNSANEFYPWLNFDIKIGYILK